MLRSASNSGHLRLIAAWLFLSMAAPILRAQDEAKKPAPANSEASGEAPDDPMPTMLPHLENKRIWLSGQANFIFQTHPPFRAAYSGSNSLNPHYEKATSRVLTLYTGVRLNDSTEFLLDIEEAGGAALSTGLGLAGNTDLDIVSATRRSARPHT